jgi:flagellar L-ring protein FlgH
MKALCLTPALILLTLTWVLAQGRPGSTFPSDERDRRVSSFRSLYTDPIASRKGDPITIVINLSSDARQQKSISTSKSSSFNTGTLTSEILPDELMKNINGIGLTGAASDHTGEGDVRDRETMTTTISGTVVDVLPNNTMKIEAKRSFNQGKEKTTIFLTGLIRPEDISNTNLINSTRIANLEVQQEGAGALSRARNKGWLVQLFEWVSPF